MVLGSIEVAALNLRTLRILVILDRVDIKLIPAFN
jgi:hypothetical protein